MLILPLISSYIPSNGVSEFISGINYKTKDQFVIDTNIVYNKEWDRNNNDAANKVYIELLEEISNTLESSRDVNYEYAKDLAVIFKKFSNRPYSDITDLHLTSVFTEIWYKCSVYSSLTLDSILEDFEKLLEYTSDLDVSGALLKFSHFIKSQAKHYLETYKGMETQFYNLDLNITNNTIELDNDVIVSSFNIILPVRLGMSKNNYNLKEILSTDKILYPKDPAYNDIKNMLEGTGYLPLYTEIYYYSGETSFGKSINKSRIYKRFDSSFKIEKTYTY